MAFGDFRKAFPSRQPERHGGRSLQVGRGLPLNVDAWYSPFLNAAHCSHKVAPTPANSHPARKSHRLPPAVYATTEYEYFFTICGRHQGEPFRSAALAKVVIDSLLWTKERYGWLLFCYCLIPDHLHFVCRLTEAELRLVNCGARGWVPEGVLDHLARFKSYTTNRSWQCGAQGSLWQKSSFDRVLDMSKPFEEVAQYTLENPVRKGLVREWTEWPYAKIIDQWW
jgi:REP element-mobilizing transposase RayT